MTEDICAIVTVADDGGSSGRLRKDYDMLPPGDLRNCLVALSSAEPLLAVPAFLFVEQFRAVLPVGLGFAAGAMVWMVGRELLPEALSYGPRRAVVADTAVAFVLMLALQLRLAG